MLSFPRLINCSCPCKRYKICMLDSPSVVPTPYVDGAQEQAKPSIKTIMTARLSADRRVVDEATASLFLSAFKEYINKPELLLL